ncbi:MAG: CvpA family protein [bacterium]
MPGFISFIYILDIAIIIFVLAHRGMLHGVFEESFYLLATMLAAFGALTNFDWVATIIKNYWSPSSNIYIPEAIAILLIYLFIRGILAGSTLYIVGKIRRIELIKPISKVSGAIIGAIKGLIIASMVLVFLYYMLSPTSMLSDPLRNPNDVIVQWTMKSATNIYNVFVGIFGVDHLKFLG